LTGGAEDGRVKLLLGVLNLIKFVGMGEWAMGTMMILSRRYSLGFKLWGCGFTWTLDMMVR
jgi:hypothetical protein